MAYVCYAEQTLHVWKVHVYASTSDENNIRWYGLGIRGLYRYDQQYQIPAPNGLCERAGAILVHCII